MNTHNSDLPHEPDWKRVFDNAAESPPPRVWDAIERELDADRRPGGIILPLWAGSVGFGWWASGVAAALVVAVGLGWQWLQPSAPVVVENRPGPTVSKTEPINTKPNPFRHKSSGLSTINVDNTSLQAEFVDKLSKKAYSPQYTQQRVGRNTVPPALYPAVGQQPSAPTLAQLLATNIPANASTNPDWRIGTPGLLTNRPTRFSDLIMNRDIESVVGIPPVGLPDGSAPTTRKRARPEAWVSANVLSGDFTPNVALASLPPASAAVANSYAAAFQNTAVPVSVQQQPFANRKQGAASVQIGVGVQLTKHWLAEAGIAYTEGHSEVLSPLRTLPPAYDLILPAGLSVGTSTQYLDLIQARLARSQTSGKFAASAPFDVPAPGTYYDNSQRRAVANDYTFVQLPVQAGYEFRPRRKLGVAVLGGLIANIFVRNRVDNHLEVKPADGIYERLAWAGSASLRLRYRTGNWSATLAGVYQRAIQPTTRPGADIVSRPDMMGLTMGLNRHF